MVNVFAQDPLKDLQNNKNEAMQNLKQKESQVIEGTFAESSMLHRFYSNKKKTCFTSQTVLLHNSMKLKS